MGAISKGTPRTGCSNPASCDDKFLRLTRCALGEPGAAALYERLQQLEEEKNLAWLGAQA